MNKPKILVVDDEQLSVELIEETLSGNYKIVTAYDGAEALLQVEKTSPDLILLDLRMPGMSGYEVCKRLKENEKTIHIPVVIVTALNEKENKIKSIEAGADDFLNKPVDLYELEVRVRSLLKVKRYYDSLIEEQEKLLTFKSALDSMDDCVIITNTSGDIRYVNPAFEKKFGYSLFEINGKHISIIQHAESALALDKESIIQDTNHEWKGYLIAINKHKLRLSMGIKCSSLVKGKRQMGFVFVLRERS